MNAVTLEKEQALRSQIDEAQGELGKLEQDLAVVEGELQGLMTERERYESLAHVCDSLEKLSAVGAAELFWGDGFQDPSPALLRVPLQEPVPLAAGVAGSFAC